MFKPEVMQFFKEFYDNGKLASGLNNSFITLIPKVDCPSSISDFRPISLIGSIYKILAKVLANRLKKVVPRVIGEAQSAFLGGRNILDGVLIANEFVDWWKVNRKKGVVLKLDFQKTYDSVNWDCLLSMMNEFGFRVRWRGWIWECLQSSRCSVLVNGLPTAEFKPSKDLRQGDPLSPFLFNIVAEGLNMLMLRARPLGLLSGVTMGNDVMISHLQFTDDTIIFCEAKLEEVMVVKRILRCFELVSGLKINFHKSSICGIGVPENEMEVFASRLCCRVQKLPLSYLG